MILGILLESGELFPTRTGMIRSPLTPHGWVYAVPHTYGDDPLLTVTAPVVEHCSPRTRGDDPDIYNNLAAMNECSPTHAGMIRPIPLPSFRPATVPHVGTNRSCAAERGNSEYEACSPHVRG